MEASSLFSTANAHYVNEEYQEALNYYTCAVTLQEDCVEYRACRAAAFLKLGRFAEALEDAEQALKIGPRTYMACYWKGIALFYLGNFSAAKPCFEESLRIAPNARAPRAMWVRKCDAELSGSTLPLGGVAAEVSNRSAGGTEGSARVVAPAPQAAPAATAAPVQAVAPASAPAAPSPAAPAPATSSEASAAAAAVPARKETRRQWYQNQNSVIVTIFAKGVDEQACKVDFGAQALSLSFPLPGTSDEEYSLELDLGGEIDPEKCRIEVSKVKVEVVLAKRNFGEQWKDLELVKELEKVLSPEQPAYPTSSSQKKDWGRIDRDIEEELKNEKPEGDAALNKLFKEIYDRADDDTRRAMNKSFQTSGGTVLSTNWGEVARSDYEGKDRPTPPEGQAWKDWREK
eukprot:TRINITY_DN61376_c0_g1_i1.p1 TRINITY_DN61376_c0_g1~~TRINITY_DN61376_c0_g1_i1.p1  ORF type:complete len:415 (-),score=102.36 TRINITY_DN61376_c0_g1_i1:81-1286(-)